MNQPVSAATKGAGNSTQRAVSDAQIQQTMRAKLAKSKIGADHFTFTVSQGVVTFEGKTDVMQHKGAATRMAKSSGAIAVHNNIRISDAAKAKAVARLQKYRPGGTATPADVKSADALTASPAGLPRATVVK